MNALQHWRHSIRLYFRHRKEYFITERRRIAQANLRVLRYLSLTAALLISLLNIGTRVFYPRMAATGWYLAVALACFCLWVLGTLYSRARRRSEHVVNALCLVFLALMCATTVSLSVFDHPDAPEVYVSIFVMLLPVVFILKQWKLLVLMAAYEGAFLLLARRFKSPSVFPHDAFITFIACVFAIIILQVVCDLRVSDSRERQRYMRLSTMDVLTGLLNKASFAQQARRYLQMQEDGPDGALLILDLDDFKAVNDTLGHQAGDVLLADFGRLLRELFRDSDLAGRVGGDEFAVLLPGMTDEDELRRLLERFRGELRALRGDLPRTCSIGAAVTTGHTADYTALYTAADRALYAAKSRGKDCAEIARV